MHTRRLSHSGFTLIELLVVVVTLAVLAAILVPVIAQARARAGQRLCLSNMKQLGTALHLYMQDYDQTLAGNDTHTEGCNQPLGFLAPYNPAVSFTRRNWARDVQPYIKNLHIYRCPQARPHSSFYGGNPPHNETGVPGGGNTSYVLNGIVADKPLAVIPVVAQTIYLREFSVYARTAQIRPHAVNPQNPTLFTQFDHLLADNLHREGTNLLFCDCHARWRQKTGIRYTEFGADPTYSAPCAKRFLDLTGSGNGIQCRAAF